MSKSSKKLNSLNGGESIKTPSPSQLRSTEPATTAGFRFIKAYGDIMGTRIKHADYRPAKLYDKGKKWFVYYSFRIEGKMRRFKVYEDLNRVEGEEKRDYARKLITGINHVITKEGFDPRNPPCFIPVKTWTLVQGLNYFKQNLQDRGLRKRTIQSYESVLRMMYESFAPLLQTSINEVKKHQVASILRSTHSKNGWSNSTFNNNLTFIRSIFNYLVEADIMETNPAKSVKPLPQSVSRHKYFDDETFEKIKNNAPEDLLRFIMFLYHTGTRPNEARQLTYDHILRDRKLLFIPSAISKNKKDDYVPLSDYVLKNFKGTGFIFGVSVNYFSQKFNKLKEKIGLDKNHTLYSIKHTRAIHLAHDGANPYSIMTLFRHSGLDITMAYLKDLGVDINREAADLARV